MKVTLWRALPLLQLFATVSALPHGALSLVPRFKVIVQNHHGLPQATTPAATGAAQNAHQWTALDLAQSSDSPESPASLVRLRTSSSTSSAWPRTLERFSSLQGRPRDPGPAHTSPRTPSPGRSARATSFSPAEVSSPVLIASEQASSARHVTAAPNIPRTSTRGTGRWWKGLTNAVRKPFKKCAACVSPT